MRRRKQHILVELTPLLDVIMLILFLVLVQSQGIMDTIYADTQETLEARLEYYAQTLESRLEYYSQAFEASVEEMHRELGEEFILLQQRSQEFDLLQLGLLTEDTTAIIVTIVSQPLNVNERHISVQTPTGVVEIPLNWDGIVREMASTMLNSTFAQAAGDSVATFVIFQIDGLRVFEADYHLVRSAINNQRLHIPHFYSVVMNIDSV